MKCISSLRLLKFLFTLLAVHTVLLLSAQENEPVEIEEEGVSPIGPNEPECAYFIRKIPKYIENDRLRRDSFRLKHHITDPDHGLDSMMRQFTASLFADAEHTAMILNIGGRLTEKSDSFLLEYIDFVEITDYSDIFPVFNFLQEHPYGWLLIVPLIRKIGEADEDLFIFYIDVLHPMCGICSMDVIKYYADIEPDPDKKTKLLSFKEFLLRGY